MGWICLNDTCSLKFYSLFDFFKSIFLDLFKFMLSFLIEYFHFFLFLLFLFVVIAIFRGIVRGVKHGV